jgi:hypothetical protein
MWAVFDLLGSNLGVTFQFIIILVFSVGSFIFIAKDFTIGMMVFLLTHASIFIWFYEAGFNYYVPLTLFFMGLVILSLNLYSHLKQSNIGGVI